VESPPLNSRFPIESALGFVSPKKRMTIVNAVAISMAESIAAISPNGEMGTESVADINGT
jgi:hypothetical protein